jgi:hypothetical protein
MTQPARQSAQEFMAAAPPSLNGNTPWAQRYAKTLRKVLEDHAARAPRTLQVHLGPSELGVMCDRQVAGKLAGLPATNHVVDPWPSIRGTALHAWAADAFMSDNARYGYQRWAAEVRVVPHVEHSGTADLYDAAEVAVVDHKFLGDSSMAKVRKHLPRKYFVQLLLYGLGYLNAGLPVNRVVLAAYPATASSLDDMYVWEHKTDYADPDSEDNVLLRRVWEQTRDRKQWAQYLINHANADNGLALRDVPADTGEDRDTECYFCPFYRPQARDDKMYGCPGPDAGPPPLTLAAP